MFITTKQGFVLPVSGGAANQNMVAIDFFLLGRIAALSRTSTTSLFPPNRWNQRHSLLDSLTHTNYLTSLPASIAVTTPLLYQFILLSDLSVRTYNSHIRGTFIPGFGRESMDGGSGVTVGTTVNMAEILELGGARYKVLDELTRTLRRTLPPRQDDDSVSTRPFSDGKNEFVIHNRVDAMERTVVDLVHRIDDMMVSRDSGPRRRPPLQNSFPRSQDAFVCEYLDRERMDIPAQDGKPDLTDFFVHHPIPKPYMFVEKHSLTCAKKKLEYSPSITSSEYVHAFVALLCDGRARDPSTLLQQLRHLKDVVHDSSHLIIVSCWINFGTWEFLKNLENG